MPVKLTWFGHATFLLEIDATRVLVDPFFNENPTSPVKADDVQADFILLTHGHFDHVADAASIAQRTEATVVANFEIGEWIKRQGIAEDKVIGMNPGGGVTLPFGRVKMTIAHHSSSLPDGSYGGVAGGFLLELESSRIYLSGDTGLFLDMKLIGLAGLDLAVLPIGDLFTMGPEDSIEAVKMLSPQRVVPCHFNTWPPITQDAEAWARAVERETAAQPAVLEPGRSVEW